MRQNEPSVRPILGLLAGLSAMLLIVAPGGPMLEWLRDSGNATSAQAISSIVQAVFAAALFITTIVTIWLARKSANATADAAAATRDAVREASRAREQAREQHDAVIAESERQREQARIQHAAALAESERQRLDLSRPYVALRRLRAPTTAPQDPVLARVPHAEHFTVLLVNVGGGPALDIAGRIDGSPLPYARQRWNPSDDADPLALGTREEVEITFKLDTDPMAWQSLYDPLARGESPGVVVVSYRDVHGDRWESRAPLERLGADPNDRTITLKLGALVVEAIVTPPTDGGRTNA